MPRTTYAIPDTENVTDERREKLYHVIMLK